MSSSQSDHHHVVVIEDPLYFEQNKILDDLLVNCAPMEGNQLNDKGVETRPLTASTSTAGIQENQNVVSKDEQHKVMHRDIERQRRQEMTALYASLRSLLPLEYIKGKRAVSDHMHQAVNYITHMQKKMGQMRIRRDKLKKFSNNIAPVRDADLDQNTNINASDSSNCVKLNLCKDGIEILINSSTNIGESFPLSKVLANLLERGLNVTTCISTRMDERCLYRIQIEHNDPTTVDLSELQERLVYVIKIA